MMQLLLTRSEQIPDGTFGTLEVQQDGVVTLKLFTMEDDWLNNAPGKSCIPAGSYTLHRTIFYKHGYETFEVTGVPGRSRILIHPANTEEDVEGCIGVGLRRGKVMRPVDEDTGATNVLKDAVVASKEAFAYLMQAMSHVDEARLDVVWAPGLPV